MLVQLGSISATPTFHYTETGLMAFHRTKKVQVVSNENEIVIHYMMNVTMTFDHRVADGGDVVRFTNQFKSILENPLMFMVDLI